MNEFCKTKLIATFGPSLEKFLGFSNEFSEQYLSKYQQLVDSGVDVFRFNMSHDTLAKHQKHFEFIRTLNLQTNRTTGIMIDTMGPEIRVQKIQNNDPKLNVINQNQIVTLYCDDPSFIGDGSGFSVCDLTKTYQLCNDVVKNDIIFIEDGKLVLKVLESDVNQKIIKTISLSNNYLICSNKRINLFNKSYSLPFLSDYDKQVIKLAVEWDADFLAISFLSNLEQIKEVKRIINNSNKSSKIKLIAKIETYEATNNIEKIIKYTDGIMVARGDLSLEIGYEKVPVWQDRIMELCQKYQKISIIATQMLDSLETKLIPTRAEVTDCYYAVKSNTDATMLSGESASGHNPLNAILTMKNICSFSESSEFITNPKMKNVLSKFYLMIFKLFFKNKQNILLNGLNEKIIRLITNNILDKNFYLLDNNLIDAKKIVLYKNLTIIKEQNELKLEKIGDKTTKIINFLVKF